MAFFVDFFNTTVYRQKSANDTIFDFAVALGKRHNFEPSAVYNLFLKHKRKLAVRRVTSVGEAEYTFSEIMTAVAEDLFRPFGDEGKEEFLRDALPVYEDTEAEGFTPNTGFLSFLAEKRAAGEKIYLVSQFYCGRETMSRWLTRLGADGLFTEIYVSCDYLKSKRRGTLYDYVLKTESLSPADVTMIGDNRHSDYVMAKRKGMSAKLLRHTEPRVSATLKKRAKRGANVYEFEKLENRNADFRLANFAFPLYLVIKRLAQFLERGGVKDILFLSREGKFFRRLFELYREETGGCPNVQTHYFLGSRNSMMTAALLPLEEEKFECVVKSTFMNMLSANTFLISLGFSKEQIDLLQSRLDFNFKHTYLRFYAKKQFCKLLQDEEFRRIYEENRTSCAKAFRAYLDSFGLDYEKNGIVMFDVGWRGLVQDLMQKFLGENVRIHGYYLGTAEAQPSDFVNKTGLLCSDKNKSLRGYHYYQRYKMLYEQICRADHGSAERYVLNPDGTCSVQLDTERSDKELFEELFKPLQDRIAETFREICRLETGRYSATEATISAVYYRAIKHMTRADYRWQLNAEDCHYDTFCRIGYRFTLVGRGLRIFAYRLADAWFVLKYAGRHSLGKVRYSSSKTYRKPKKPKNS